LHRYIILNARGNKYQFPSSFTGVTAISVELIWQLYFGLYFYFRTSTGNNQT